MYFNTVFWLNGVCLLLLPFPTKKYIILKYLKKNPILTQGYLDLSRDL
jgi:hypothetical protein